MRINPYELHVADSEFWETLYGPGRVDKYDYFINRQNIPRSIFATPDHNLHKLRKAPLLPLFSKKRISEFQPVIREKLDVLCTKIDQYVASGEHFTINRAMTAFSGDVITTYVFGQSYQHLESPDFTETFHEPFMAASESGHVALQSKWIYPLMESLPEWLVLKMQPHIYLILQLAKVSHWITPSPILTAFRTSMSNSRLSSLALRKKIPIIRPYYTNCSAAISRHKRRKSTGSTRKLSFWSLLV